ncbi:sugar phosphate isomerase/epimerase family protein [Lentibacillus salinarum]|uniref:Sugar phosphate isomerase/epimerase family protein n=1 Tax=Lentibacillus salinarum TaxID=446820 RepID=A0ABW3ZVL2_9BACI
MSVKLGIAPCSWGVWFPEDDYQPHWTQCLDQVEQAGYRAIELGPWGYLPNQYEDLKNELDKRNIDLVATTLMDDLTSDTQVQRMIADLDEMAQLQTKFPNAKYVVLMDATYTDLFTGEPVHSKVLNDQEWASFVQNINKVKHYAKEKYGLEVIYHPHGETHVETEEQIERLLKDSDIQLCLDTGHHAYAGGDPVTFIERHRSRIAYLHIKNCNENVRRQKELSDWSLAEAVKNNIFCEPEYGSIDMVELMDVLAKNDFSGWAIVEQDMYPVPFDKPLPIARRTKQYLDGIGMKTPAR